MNILFENLEIIPLWLWLIFTALMGSLFGSFFNVVIWRMPRGESVMHPPSSCPQCGSGIAWYDNVPVLGWLWLRGKCRNCRNPISVEYPIVEFIGAAVGCLMILGVKFWMPYALWGDYLMAFALGLILIPVIVIDFRHFLIPDMMVLPGAIIAWSLASFRYDFSFFESLISGWSVALGLWLFATVLSWVIKKRAMGFGDVKYMLFAASILGWQDGILNIVLGAFIGLAFIPLMAIFKSSSPSGMIPFGPMLGLGTVIAFFWSEPIWATYFKMIGL